MCKQLPSHRHTLANTVPLHLPSWASLPSRSSHFSVFPGSGTSSLPPTASSPHTPHEDALREALRITHARKHPCFTFYTFPFPKKRGARQFSPPPLHMGQRSHNFPLPRHQRAFTDQNNREVTTARAVRGGRADWLRLGR